MFLRLFGIFLTIITNITNLFIKSLLDLRTSSISIDSSDLYFFEVYLKAIEFS